MAKKLSDAEFVERTRENNRRRSERQRQRLEQAGRKALTVWIPAPVITALTTAANEQGATIADTAAQWLMTAAALDTTTPTTTPTPTLNQAERNRRIRELHRQGIANREIGRQIGISEATVRRALKEQV